MNLRELLPILRENHLIIIGTVAFVMALFESSTWCGAIKRGDKLVTAVVFISSMLRVVFAALTSVKKEFMLGVLIITILESVVLMTRGKFGFGAIFRPALYFKKIVHTSSFESTETVELF